MKMWGIGAKRQRKYEEFARSAKQSMKNLREAPQRVWGICAKRKREYEELARSAKESMRNLREAQKRIWGIGAKRHREYEELARSAKENMRRWDLFQKGYNFFEIHGNMNTWVYEQKFITVWIIKYEGLFATGAVWFWKNYLKHNERPAARFSETKNIWSILKSPPQAPLGFWWGRFLKWGTWKKKRPLMKTVWDTMHLKRFVSANDSFRHLKRFIQ